MILIPELAIGMIYVSIIVHEMLDNINGQNELCSIFVPQPRELLHGYVYRLCKLFGVQKAPHILTDNGRWSCQVKLNDEVKQCFDALTDRQLFELLLHSAKWHRVADRCSPTAPTSFIGLMKYFVYGEPYQKLWQSSKPVRFCSDCICESIEQRGFGCFMGDWVEEFRYCRKHNTTLLQLPKGKLSTALQSIEHILKGHIPEKVNKAAHDCLITPMPIGGYFANEKDDIPLAPCLESDVQNWIETNKQSLPKSIAYYFSDHSCSENSGTIMNISRLDDDEFFELIMALLMASAHQPFREFWEQKAKYHRIYCGVMEKSGLFEELHIRTNADCKGCNDHNWQDCSVKVAERGYSISARMASANFDIENLFRRK